MSKPQVSVIVPFYNEAKTIEELVRRLDDISQIFESCVFVDDGSTDGSYEILEQCLQGASFKSAVLRQENLGKGAAVRTGLNSVNTSHAAILDADLELDPKDLIGLWEPINTGLADASLGYRQFLSQSSYTYRYKVGNRVLSGFYGLIFNQVITDVMCGYKIFPTNLFREVSYKSRRFSIEIDILAALWRREIQPFEFPVSYRARNKSQGKIIGYSDAAFVLLRMLYLRLRS